MATGGAMPTGQVPAWLVPVLMLGGVIVALVALNASVSGEDSDPSIFPRDDGASTLYDACDAGDMGACDLLYYQSPYGSDVEYFGSTCGYVSSSELTGSCEDFYG
ncbi:MAG: hypothetical protein ACR2JF_14865 [Iamia sp.]